MERPGVHRPCLEVRARGRRNEVARTYSVATRLAARAGRRRARRCKNYPRRTDTGGIASSGPDRSDRKLRARAGPRRAGRACYPRRPESRVTVSSKRLAAALGGATLLVAALALA